MQDKQLLIEQIKRQMPDKVYNSEAYEFKRGLEIAMHIVENTEEINPMPCRKCKYLGKVNRKNHPEMKRDTYCTRTGMVCTPYDYCSWGVESEGNTKDRA